MEELVAGLKAGKGDAYERFVREYGDRLQNFCRRLVGPSDAPDVVQEVYIRVHRSIERYQPRGRFESWLFTIANNLSLDFLRRKRPEPTEDLEIVGKAGPQDDVAHRELREALMAEVDRLPAEQREVFLLRERSCLTFREIAEKLGCPLNTALGRMHYAMEHLREALKDYL
jgi:RNA polymerase sigma-70 factor (ECF subfamily)